MNSIVKKYTVVGINSDASKIVDSELEAIEFIKEQDANDKFMITPTYQVVPSEQATFRASIIMPIWKAPIRTKRAIMSVVNQDTNGWQLLCLGDGCENFAELLHTKWFKELQAKAYLNGNEIVGLNTMHHGGYGYHQRDLAKTMATGKWCIFVDNDDVVKPNHVSARLEFVESTKDEYDFVYFNTWLEPINWFRDTTILQGKIGNSEVMYRTSFLKQLMPLSDIYGHDFLQIQEAVHKGARYRKIVGEPTYIVKSLPDRKEDTIMGLND